MNPQGKTIPGWVWAGVASGVVYLAMRTPTPPPPGPVPPPPGPTPAPIVLDGSFLVALTDNANRTPEQAAILESEDLGKWFVDKKVGWLVIDKDAARYKDDGYDRLLAAENLTPPAVVLWSKDGSKHRSRAAPDSVEAVKQWVEGKPATGLPFIIVDGEKRYLTSLPPSQARFMAPRGGEWATAQQTIPRDKWKEISRRSRFPASDWIYDQDGLGACVGNGSTDALRKARVMAGMTDQRLAPGCTYAQINGGHDGGAVISDSLTVLQQTGTITSKTLGSDQKPCFAKQLPKGWKDEAKRFRIEEAYHCANFDEMCSAIQLGYIVVYGMQVGNNFNQFTSEGVPGISRGPGNHCMHADGLKHLASGAWALDNCNSWGTNWGPDKNGRCYLVEGHFLNGDQPDAYAVKTAVADPLDPIKPPKPPRQELGHVRIWEWRTYDNSTAAALYADGKHVGSYRFSDGVYMPIKAGQWGEACEPPLNAPSVPPQSKPPQLQPLLAPSAPYPTSYAPADCGPRG